MSEIEIEKVEYGDKEAVEEISSEIWEGHDYLPKVFNDWVADGGFYKGVLEGKVIGVDKYTRHSEKVIWLEGLRVHPDYQKRGYGREIAEGVREILDREEDYDILRFMTAKRNVESIHMAEEAGFERVLSLHCLIWERAAVDGGFDGISRVGVEDLDEVWNLIEESEELRENRGFYIPNWTAYDMDEELVRGEIERGKCFAYLEDGDVSGAAFYDHYRPYDIISIPFLCGNDRVVRELVDYGRHMVDSEGHDTLGIKTASERIKKMALDVGMGITDYEEAFIYELRV